MSSGLFRFIIWMHFTTSRPFLYAHQYFSKIGWKKFVLFLDYNERIEPQHTNDYCFGTVFSFHQFQFHFVFGFCFVPLTHTVRWLGWNVIDSDRIFLADASFLGYLFPLNWLYTCIIRHCRLYIGWFALPDTLILLVSSYTPELFGCRSGERPRDKTHLFFLVPLCWCIGHQTSQYMRHEEEKFPSPFFLRTKLSFCILLLYVADTHRFDVIDHHFGLVVFPFSVAFWCFWL